MDDRIEEMRRAADENLRVFREEAETYAGTLVIMGHEVLRLNRLIEDEPDDYYWEVESWGGKRRWITGCEGVIGLRHVIPDGDYDRMARVWNLNHVESSRCKLSNE